MKSYFGGEYPAAITVEGVRVPLASERRWTRIYAAEDSKTSHYISRFMDGSAAITFGEFAREWPGWTEPERLDFCGSCSWLHEQADFPDMLRYIMEQGDVHDWSAIANSVGTRLPRDEAFELLKRALRSTELGEASNISQGISLTKHPDAEELLRSHLGALWAHPSLWHDDDFNNWLAYEATCCIEHLIAVGAQPADFTEQVRALTAHPCSRNRNSCRRFLAKHFP